MLSVVVCGTVQPFGNLSTLQALLCVLFDSLVVGGIGWFGFVLPVSSWPYTFFQL